MSRPTTSLPLSSGPSFTPPPRSSTHPAKPRHHHIPHHPHRTHHHHHHDKSVPQSAIQPTSSNPFGEFLAKQTSKIDGFQTPPREREQQQLQQQQREEIAREQKVKEDVERERAMWKEVERSRTSRKAADDALRNSLTTLSTLSTSTTRRLDYTYYSLLSSLSSLTNTIADLHKLCSSTNELSTRFHDESTLLSSETKLSIDSTHHNFDAQAQRIEDLEKRMRNGRTRVNNLSLRLDTVRTKVETSARRDVEDENRLGRRLKMLWGFLGFWIILLLVLVVARQRGMGNDVRSGELVELSDREGREFYKGRIEEERTEVMGRKGHEPKTTRWESGNGVDAEATLRLFDEL